MSNTPVDTSHLPEEDRKTIDEIYDLLEETSNKGFHCRVGLILINILKPWPYADSIFTRMTAHMSYEIGFTGHGPTLLDTEPEPVTLTRFEKFIWWLVEPAFKNTQRWMMYHRRVCWYIATLDI